MSMLATRTECACGHLKVNHRIAPFGCSAVLPGTKEAVFVRGVRIAPRRIVEVCPCREFKEKV